MPEMVPAINLMKLAKRFGERVIFDNLTLEIPSNSITCVIGPSGVGKTCMLRIIAGIDMEFEGRVFTNGRDVTDLKPNQRRLAFLFQHPVLYPYLSVYDNVRFPMRIQKVPHTVADRRVRALSERLRFSDLLSRAPDTLSGGERQRVALARAFVTEAPLILLDEPLKASFEPALKSELRSQIKQLHREMGGTIVLITHDQEEGLELGSYLIIMLPTHQPTLVETKAAYTHPPSISIAQFIGGGNVITGKYDEQTDCLVTGSGLILRLSGPLPKHCKNAVKWLIRPEAISLIPGFSFKIVDIIYQGARSRLKLGSSNDIVRSAYSDCLIDAIVDSNFKIAFGDFTDLKIDHEKILGFDEADTLCSA